MKVAVIGANISGCLTSLKLYSKNKEVKIDLYEQKSTIMSGSPYAHLHAGGFLYPELNIEQCKQLLNDSIYFASYFRDFNNCIHHRPTVIAYNAKSSFCVIKLLQKCIVLQQHYRLKCFQYSLDNYIFGDPLLFFATYSQYDILYYKNHGRLPPIDYTLYPEREYHDPYVETFCSLLHDIDSIKYPFVSVIEPGINEEEISRHIVDSIVTNSSIKLHINSPLNNTNICYDPNENVWYVNNVRYDKIFNCSGASSHSLFQDYLDKELLELKAAWIIHNTSEVRQDQFGSFEYFPEIAIIGERSTVNGTLQIIPRLFRDCSCDCSCGTGDFQIHYMSTDSSVVFSSCDIRTFQETIMNDSLNPNEINHRSNSAIKYLTKLFPYFQDFTLKDCVWGIQRIPDNCIQGRVSKLVSSCNNTFLDIQTVKATSILRMLNETF
jgi:hypothetical protein